MSFPSMAPDPIVWASEVRRGGCVVFCEWPIAIHYDTRHIGNGFMSYLRKLTSVQNAFLEPTNAVHRQYEALRAYFIDGNSSKDVAKQFGYTPGSFRVLCCQFRNDPHREFFQAARRKVEKPGKVKIKETLRDRIVSLRKKNLSVYDISSALREDGHSRSPPAVWKILHEEGFEKLPRRQDDERPSLVRPDPAAVADVRQFSLETRQFRTKFGGLFLFVPDLVRMEFDTLMRKCQLPSSRMVPSPHAMRSLLGLKMFGNARRSHMMSHVFDGGLAFFAGLNVVPKRAFLTEYSCRIQPKHYTKLMRRWFDAAGNIGLERGTSFDLDFHTIPFHGDDALVEKHYVSKRSRRQKGVLAFLVQDADKRVFCYANADIRKGQENDEILAFVKFWKQRTGALPGELVFDSKLTTYANLNRLNKMKEPVPFMTLQRRSPKLLQDVEDQSASAWRQVNLSGVSRIYRTPRILDRRVDLRDYEGPIRQIVIKDLGHEQPTFLLTNQMRRSAVKLIERYAQRMLIENGIADGIDFFHMDALSSAVAMKVNCDLQLTLMGSSLYRLLAAKVGNGYTKAKSRHIFNDFIDAAATVSVTPDEVLVRFGKRAHNPLLLAAGFHKVQTPVPWWGGRTLTFQFG